MKKNCLALSARYKSSLITKFCIGKEKNMKKIVRKEREKCKKKEEFQDNCLIYYEMNLN